MSISVKSLRLIWVPRGLVILFILFFSILALDVFSDNAPLLTQITGFLMHLIPSFVMIAFLWATWNRPALAGWLFLMLGAAFTVSFDTYQYLGNFLVISLPLIVVGALFLFSSKRKVY